MEASSQQTSIDDVSRPSVRDSLGTEGEHSLAWKIVRILILIAGIGSLSLFNGYPLVSAIAVAAILAILLLVDRSQAFRLWAWYVLGIVVFTHVRALADSTFISTSYEYVISADRFVFFGHVPTIWMQEHFYEFGNVSRFDSLMVGIHLSYFIVPYAVAVGLALWNRLFFARYVAGMLATYYLGLLIYYAVPTSPPWLAAYEGYLPEVVRIMEVISLNISQETYEQGYRIAGSNDVAAMPSLHLGITALIMLAHWQFGWIYRIAGVMYTALMGLALVYLGEHYVIDLMAGLLVAFAGWRIGSYLISRYFQSTEESATPDSSQNETSVPDHA